MDKVIGISRDKVNVWVQLRCALKQKSDEDFQGFLFFEGPGVAPTLCSSPFSEEALLLLLLMSNWKCVSFLYVEMHSISLADHGVSVKMSCDIGHGGLSL